MNFSDMERDAYEDHLKWMRDQIGALDRIAEKNFAEGKIEGKAEGKIETVKNMLAKNLDDKFISECTGLSIEEIVKLLSLQSTTLFL
jgi:predicted transposase/invertase (TIGR01784 family)